MTRGGVTGAAQVAEVIGQQRTINVSPECVDRKCTSAHCIASQYTIDGEIVEVNVSLKGIAQTEVFGLSDGTVDERSFQPAVMRKSTNSYDVKHAVLAVTLLCLSPDST